MTPATKLLNLSAACAACCAIPILLPLIGGLGLAGFSTAMVGWGAGLIVIAIVVAVGLVIAVLRRRAAASACGTPTGACGTGLAPTRVDARD